MVLKSKLTGKALAVLFGSAVAVGGTGMLVKDDQGQPVISSLLSAGDTMPQKEAAPEAKPDVVASLPETKTEEPVAEPAIVEPELPAFDVLRVEKDGSVVVAGRAPADSMVEIIADGEVMANGKAGPSGEFAIVFDQPLSAGDHELLIRATPKDGEPLMSAEAGIVTVPDENGEVMVMVQKAGEASRILQAPAAPVEEETEVAALEQPASEVEPAKTDEAEVKTEAVTTQAETSSTTPETTKPVLETMTEVDTTVKAEVSPAAEPEPVPVVESKPVMVQAVDVEPNKVFVAGTAEPDSFVRFYINDQLKGSVKVAPNGTFLFELNEGLTPGKHDLRVDALGGNGGEVISRAAVVVDHESDAVEVAEVKPEQTETVAKAEPESKIETETNISKESSETAQVEQEPVVKPTAEIASAASEPKTDEAAPKVETAVEAEADAKPVIITGRSVIIRRGDNLWRISRRMLGEGRKYTIIFSANNDQIKNPNRIYPGQVFDVPDEEPSVAGETQKSSG